MMDPKIGPHQAVTADPKVFVGILQVAVRLVGEVAHGRLGADHPSLWLADQQDVDSIAKPASRILSRHIPMATDKQAQDVADGIEIAVGATGYVLKNRGRKAEWEAAGRPTIELTPHQQGAPE